MYRRQSRPRDAAVARESQAVGTVLAVRSPALRLVERRPQMPLAAGHATNQAVARLVQALGVVLERPHRGKRSTLVRRFEELALLVEDVEDVRVHWIAHNACVLRLSIEARHSRPSLPLVGRAVHSARAVRAVKQDLTVRRKN